MPDVLQLKVLCIMQENLGQCLPDLRHIEQVGELDQQDMIRVRLENRLQFPELPQQTSDVRHRLLLFRQQHIKRSTFPAEWNKPFARNQMAAFFHDLEVKVVFAMVEGRETAAFGEVVVLDV